MEISTRKCHGELMFTLTPKTDIDAKETLEAIADIYVGLSAAIDSQLEQHGVEVEYGSLTYSFCVESAAGRLYEEDIFRRFIGDAELEQKAQIFVKQVIAWVDEHEVEIWDDEESPLGEKAAYLLALSHPEYVPLYTELLLRCDNDHECYQHEHINAIVEAHGLTAETLALLAHRLGGACGQWGHDQISEHKQALMAIFEQQPELKAVFLNTALKSIHDFFQGCQLWFEPIQIAASLIADSDERAQWLAREKASAIKVYGEHNIDFG